MQSGKKPWFPVKRYGYGAGLPIAWEGWVLLIGYAAFMIIAGQLLPTLLFLVLAAIVTTVVVLIARDRSDDVWRWRDGRE